MLVLVSVVWWIGSLGLLTAGVVWYNIVLLSVAVISVLTCFGWGLRGVVGGVLTVWVLVVRWELVCCYVLVFVAFGSGFDARVSGLCSWVFDVF